MVVKFDFEDRLSQDQLQELMESDVGIMITTLRQFIIERLKVLKDEIERDGAYTLITFNPKFEIRYYASTEELRYKMKSCITQDDYEYIYRLIWDKMYPGAIPPTN